jgi:hypothetical protein
LASSSPPTTQTSSLTRVGAATPGTAAPMNDATPPFGLPRLERPIMSDRQNEHRLPPAHLSFYKPSVSHLYEPLP